MSGTCANAGSGSPNASVEQHLLRRVRNVIVAAHDVRDRHVDVVDDDRQVVRRVAVRPQHDEVLDVRVVELDRARARDRGSASCRRAPGSGWRAAFPPPRARRSRPATAARTCGRSSTPSPAALPAAASRCAFSICGRAVAVVGVARRDEPLRHLAVPVEPLRLEVRAVRRRRPRALRPSRGRATACRRGCRSTMSPDDRSTSVSSMRSTKTPPVLPGVEPVEQRRAGAADVQVAGGRRGEAETEDGWDCGCVTQNCMAVRQGFEPWIQVLARITV